MRSWVMTVVVLVALVAAFVVFLFTQQGTAPAVKHDAAVATTLPGLTTMPSDSNLGAGNNGWVQSFDKKTGELTNEFRAEHFDPPVNNLMHVQHADSRFYEHDGSVLTIHAEYGDITLAESAKKGTGLNTMQSQPPSHGILYDVTLGLLETADDTVPVMTAKVPVIAFDNDTLRLNTVPFRLNGIEVPADQIPVTVRGRDYDFDGKGLLIRYNQRDRRLEYLQVDHGQRLLIKNPKNFGGVPLPGGASASAVAAGPVLMDGRPLELVSADPTAGLSEAEREQHRQKRAAATRRSATPPPPPVVKKKPKHPVKPPSTKPASTKPYHEPVAYRADFNDNVRLKEGDAPIGTADRMLATFMSEQDQASATQPGGRPADVAATGPATRVAAPAAGASPAAPATRPARRTRRSTTQPGTVAVVQPATQGGPAPTSAPATQPTQPIEITWTGKLVVVPRKFADSELKSPSDRLVEFFGRPTHLQRQGSTVDAAYVRIGVEGGRFSAAIDVNTPHVTLHDPNGTVLTTESIVADGDTVDLIGPSTASMVMAGQTPPKTLVTTWTDTAKLHLVAGGNGQKAVDHAVLRGHVDVTHPQLRMKSDVLTLGFTPVAGKDQPALSAVDAAGNVTATVTGDDGAVQTIASRTLDLGTVQQDDGTLALRTLHATGDVVAQDEKQKLLTDDLRTTLAATVDSSGNITGGPATAPAGATPSTSPATGMFAIDHLTADGHVHFSTVDGTKADSEKLVVEKQDQQQWITLTGTPAHVTDPQSTIDGNTIRVDSTGSYATVDGAGTLTGQQKSDDGGQGHPIHVVWSQSLAYDGPANKAKVLGDVVVTTRGSDGAYNHATGKRLDLTFADAPTTQPATANAAPATAPATAQAAGFGGLGGGKKQVQSLTLSDGVEVNSLVYADNDTAKPLVKRTHLYAPTITVKTNPDGSPGAMTVPTGGQMLYEDVITTTTQPSTQSSDTPTTKPTGRGSVALQWAKSMTYDPATLLANLDGDVVVIHKTTGVDQNPMKMFAPHVTAELTNGASGDAQGQQIKKMTADQGASMQNGQVQIDAAKAVYEPDKDLLTATGTPRQPVQIYDQGGGMTKGSIEELKWDVKTNQPVGMRNLTVQVNPVPKLNNNDSSTPAPQTDGPYINR